MHIYGKKFHDPSGLFLYLIILITCLFLSTHYAEYFGQNAILSLSSALNESNWSGWAFIFWEASWILIAGAILLSTLGLLGIRSWGLFLGVGFTYVLINQRNFWIFDGGDKLLVLLLVWHALLLGSHGKGRMWVTRFFTLQLALIYIQNGFFKMNPVWISWGTALNLIGSDPALAFDWVQNLSHINLKWISKIIPFMEIILPLFLFSRLKKPIAIVFILYHLMILVSLNLWFFSLVMLSWWLIFLFPPAIQDIKLKRLSPVLAGIWICLTGLQTLFLFASFKLPTSIERFLGTTYLRQNWSMFSRPQNQRVHYSIDCISKGQSSPCEEKWSNERLWDHRKLNVMVKMALRNEAGSARTDFHRYLCSQNQAAEEIRIELEVESINPETLKLLKREKIDWGTPSVCSNRE